MKRFIYLIGIFLAVTACQEVFEAPPQALLNASFYHSTTKKAMNPSISLQGVGLDSLLFHKESMFHVIFPLTIKDTTRYIIWIDSKSDSITFIHETTQRLASMESGFYYDYKLLLVKFTQNRIDSVEITDRMITTKWSENIKLYIRPE